MGWVLQLQPIFETQGHVTCRFQHLFQVCSYRKQTQTFSINTKEIPYRRVTQEIEIYPLVPGRELRKETSQGDKISILQYPA